MRRALLIVCLTLPRIAAAQPQPAGDSPPPKPDQGQAPATPVPEPTPTPAPNPTPAPVAPPITAPTAPEPYEPLHTHETPTQAELRHAAAQICLAHDPSCDWVATFSTLERRSISRVLGAQSSTVEPEPWGKLIRHVVVVNEDVFAEKNWLQFFNIFHYRSRPNRVREELTIQAGEIWDQARVEESARRLHDPLYTSVVALLPIKTGEPNTVDLLVVTRDIWSLRLNTQYTFQQGALTNLSASISENNFLGTRDVLAVGMSMDQGQVALGPTFIDKDLFGTHVNLQATFSEIITREADKVFNPFTMSLAPVVGDPKGIEDAGVLHSEGSSATVSLSRPLWSLATEWGGGAAFTYSNAIARSFTGAHGDAFELYTDPASGLPTEFRYKTWSVNANAVRQWGHDYKQQVTLGYTIADQTPSLVPSFATADPSATAMFIADVFPRTELISEPYVTYSIFQPRYRILRNVSTYELAEDLQVGPSATATLAQGLTVLGGDANFTRPTVNVAWTFPFLRDGFVAPSAGVSMRFEGGVENGWETIDNSGDVALRVASPTFPWFRLVGYAEVDTEWHNTQNQYYAIGSDTGLRGYNVNEFRSPRSESARRVVGQVELRTTPLPLWVGYGTSPPTTPLLLAGAVAFYEVGGAASSLGDIGLYNDVGVGLRALVPQLNRDVFRIDLAFPLQSAIDNPAFHPHLIAGFASYF